MNKGLARSDRLGSSMGRWLRDGHVHERTATVPNSDVLLAVEPELRPLLFEGGENGLYSAIFQWRKQGLAVRVVRGFVDRCCQTVGCAD